MNNVNATTPIDARNHAAEACNLEITNPNKLKMICEQQHKAGSKLWSAQIISGQGSY
jgi:hypothetical protein